MFYVVLRLTAGMSTTRAGMFSQSVRRTAKDSGRRACLSFSVGSRDEFGDFRPETLYENTRPIVYKYVILLRILYFIQ